MSRFKVVIPEGTTNFIHNSSFERWSSGLPLDWNLTTPSGSVSESVTLMRFGASAMRIVASGSLGEGMYQNVSTLTSGSLATASVYAYVATGTARLRILDTTGVTTYATGDVTTPGWNRIELPLTLPATGVRIALLAVGVGADITFDAAQLEQKAYATTYGDGSLGKGHIFVGETHRSASIRTAFGGRVKDIETDITSDVRINYTSGFGAVEPNVLTDAYGTLDGSYVNGIVLPQKDLALGLTLYATTTEQLEERRKTMITAFAPVRLPVTQPLYLRHTSNSIEKEIAVYPTGGLQGAKIGGQQYENIAITFTANNPLFKSPYDSAKQLGYTTPVTATSILIKDLNDNWFTFSGSADAGVYAFAFDPSDQDVVYLGGDFTTINGVSATRVAKYRISTNTVTAMGNGLGTSRVTALAVDVNGDVYAGGNFTVDGGGTSMKRIAKFAFGGSSWSTVGGGTGGGFSDGAVNQMKFDSNRNLFIAGYFTTTTAGATVNGTATLAAGATTLTAAVTGLTVDTSGNTGVKTVEIGPDDTVYWGGNFTATGIVNITKVLTGTTTPLVMASGLNSIVYKIRYDAKSNLFYIGGTFTLSGSVTMRGICYWNGVAFTEVGSGVNSTVSNLIVLPNGDVVITGTFTAINSAPFTLTQRVLRWNGAYWTQLDNELITFTDTTHLGITPNGYLSIGTFSNVQTVNTNAHTTVVNDGNAPSTALFRFTGPGKIQYIKNVTTGQQVDLNYTMISGEIVYIDFAIGKVTAVSSIRGNILNKIFVSGYDPTAFYLLPGNNDVSVFINGTTSSVTDARIIYRNSYYSGD